MSEAALYIVATPIGNLEDMSARAIQTLQQVALIAAEDIRHSKRLLQHFNIVTKLISLHEHNEQQQIAKILEIIAMGKSVALISDAGTPLISDPGFQLVVAVREKNIRVIPIPGPCAAIVALSAAGLPSDRFVFEGFLPAKSAQRGERLKKFLHETRTIIFYEAPHRILALIDDMLNVFGEDRRVVIAKELTKAFETIYSASLAEIKNWLLADPKRIKGEFVILLKGTEAKLQPSFDEEKILKILMQDLSLKQAVKLAAEITGEKKNYLYELALRERQRHQG